ncbi:MAG TPA: hemolysin family protein [Candidatus Acidoferrum sp.]|jgi:putative hemolysin|nr:hemolysin family protein [Candidatus Acidoferrum sp.]
MRAFVYTLGVLMLTAGLPVFSYLDRVYHDLGRVAVGRIHAHLETFEAIIEPRFHMSRARAAATFNMLARLWLVLVATMTAHGVTAFVASNWEAAAQMVVFLGAEVIVLMQFLPSVLLAGAPGNWLAPFIPLVKLAMWIVWPVQSVLELLVSVLHLSDPEVEEPEADQQAIEAFVDAATEEGIIEQEEARLIEQVVEFGETRVRDVMTPRPDVVSISASATLEELRKLMVNTKYSRVPAYEKSLDEVVGIAMSRDVLEVSEREAARRTVRELMRPALFVPESKFGSELLKEMQRKSQQMAIAIDEYGSMAGVVTVEDLVEEIVGEIGEEDRRPAPEVVRESGGSVVLRGSVAVGRIGEIFGIEMPEVEEHSHAATVAGLLNSVAGHVPTTGESIDFDGLRFEVLEANQRKVLRVRARPIAATSAASSHSD